MSLSSKRFYEFGEFSVDAAERLLLRQNQPVPLKPKVFDTLLLLVQTGGRVLDKDTLMQSLWPDTIVEENNLTQNISALRKILNEDQAGLRYIETVPRRGYRFIAPVRAWDEESADLAVTKHTTARIIIEEQEIGDGAADEITADSSSRPSANWVQRQRLSLVTLSILVLSLAGALVYAWFSSYPKASSGRARPAVDADRVKNSPAMEAYLRGRFFWNKRSGDGLGKSILCFKQAIEADPDFAPGYGGLADAYAFDLALWPQAESLARQALDHDATLAEPHATLGFVKMFWLWDWSGAEPEFKRAIKLNPNYATGRQWYAIYLATQDHLDEAEVEMRRARQLEPLSPSINADLAQIFLFKREYDLAIEQCRKTIELDPNFLPAHRYLFHAYWMKGENDEAMLEAYFTTRRITLGDKSPNLGVEARLRQGLETGRGPGFAEARLEELSPAPLLNGYDLAEVYWRLGNSDQAFYWLNRAADRHSYELMFLKVERSLELMHADPRFVELLRRVGLTP